MALLHHRYLRLMSNPSHYIIRLCVSFGSDARALAPGPCHLLDAMATPLDHPYPNLLATPRLILTRAVILQALQTCLHTHENKCAHDTNSNGDSINATDNDDTSHYQLHCA